MTFTFFSDTNPEALKVLKPDFGLRDWDTLKPKDKAIMWRYLERFFFRANVYDDPYKLENADPNNYYLFLAGSEYENDILKKRLINSINYLNLKYKTKSFGEAYLYKQCVTTACTDFYSIFTTQKGYVVLELLSIYAWIIILQQEQYEKDHGIKIPEEAFWYPLEEFRETLNEVFEQFGIKYHLTRTGFIPRQEEKIITEIYEPVIKVFSDPKWEKVNKILADAFSEYRNKTPQGYSTCVTHTVAAVQAYLQIVMYGKTGKGELKDLILDASKKGLIPKDKFSTDIFADINSFLMKERQETGMAHPNAEYATEKNARLVLNCAMVFFQHAIQN